MGSTGDYGPKPIDAWAGGLVWVRRRNGSWWPGRIVRIEELPENNMISPRSGTPVKLLGREDSSVDWYNLEKSKRVKSFRCGEYDQCIEKAKAAATNSSKKIVKYARREDAILQALEIEKAYLGKHNPNLLSRLDDDHEQDKAEHNMENVEEEDCNSSSQNNNSSSAPALSQSGVSFEKEPMEDRGRIPMLSPSSKRTSNDSEDEGGGIRMRGLDDLVEIKSQKRKRSQVGHVHEFLKKKSRRPALVKVLESTVLVSVPVVCDEGILSPSVSSAHDMCENGTLIENESIPELREDGCLDSLFDVPLMTEEKHSGGLSPLVSRASQKAQPEAGAQSSQSSQVETPSLRNDELNESAGTSSAHPDISQWMEKGTTSEWQSKGKRNSRRHINKNKTRVMRKITDIDGEFDAKLAECPKYHKSRPVMEFEMHKGPATESPTSQRLLPHRQSRFVVNPKYDSSVFCLRHPISDSSLYDVNVEVKSSYRPQHVPYVSLMTKHNGRPIVGHPITVEVLEETGPGLECFRTPTKNCVLATKSLKSKKIRTLSSLTDSHKQIEGKKVLVVKPKGPAVACVPLKVVFSRINEALMNSPIRAAHLVIGRTIV
ncbi:unnamed protein product [Cuscuta europaea]|uniref:PWWP domain-containing protein n=1 Tax=Cuscuta europaea TaxID=41803 RepID=A0A9P0YCT8_CUSEU|nr:unnamed protein product [Cuscuta europaea]